jgi:secondary thiamine-phosphate synthase enzyme
MPAHIMATLTGASLVLPVRDGRLALGTWQGIYLCEHRDSGGARKLLITAFGDEVRPYLHAPGDNLKAQMPPPT